MKRYAIIVAGGSGTRMQGTLPKQFLDLAGRPVLMHTLDHFHRPGIEIILVMHPQYIDYWKEQCITHHCHVPHTVVEGGGTRAESVRNGLKKVEKSSLIAVHDAVRPFIEASFLERLFQETEKEGSAIPVIPVKETLRKLDESGSKTVDRDQYRLVQTPQVFQSEILFEAFQQKDYQRFTDEASMVESLGKYSLHLTAGEERNIKLTVPADLQLALQYIKEAGL